MLLALLRGLLMFALLSASSGTLRVSAAADQHTFDQAPAEVVSTGERSRDLSLPKATISTSSLARDSSHCFEVLPPGYRPSPPRAARRPVFRAHLVRRRIPRMRDDAEDH